VCRRVLGHSRIVARRRLTAEIPNSAFNGRMAAEMFQNYRSWQTRHFTGTICGFFLIVACTVSAGAQSSKVGATIEGTITDSSGGLIPKATVSLRNPATNQTRDIATDDRGFFRAEELAVGTYEVRVEHSGFAAYQHAGIDLSLGQTVHLEIVLAPASASAAVTVTAAPAAMDTSQTSVVSSVDQERIEELPVRTRNYLDFVLLAPGVSSAPRTAPMSGSTPLVSSGFTFGGRTDSVACICSVPWPIFLPHNPISSGRRSGIRGWTSRSRVSGALCRITGLSHGN